MAVGLAHYLAVGLALFCFGLFCVLTRRNAIGVLMGVELILNAANVNFIAFSRFGVAGYDGQVFSIFVIMLAAAEQFGNRQADALSQRIEQGCLHGAFGELIVLDRTGYGCHRPCDAARYTGEQDWREIGIDRELHAFRALGTIGEAADRGALASSDDAIGHVQPHDRQCLPMHGRHRQLVRANGRQIDQNRLDLLDTRTFGHVLLPY